MFHLTKRYLDAIDKDGNSWILYFAHLKLGPFLFRYSSVLFSDAKGNVSEESSLKSCSLPLIQDTININCNPLKISGTWKKTQNGICLILWNTNEGQELVWNCHHPSAQVELTYKGKKFIADGYAETLILPFIPLKLPLEKLRWGRFTSNNTSLVWILWEGKHPLNLVFMNGEEYNDAQHSDAGFSFDNGNWNLYFQHSILIRNSKLGEVIRKYPLLKFLFPKNLLRSTEIKCKSLSELKSKDELYSNGWSIHETVTVLT